MKTWRVIWDNRPPQVLLNYINNLNNTDEIGITCINALPNYSQTNLSNVSIGTRLNVRLGNSSLGINIQVLIFNPKGPIVELLNEVQQRRNDWNLMLIEALADPDFFRDQLGLKKDQSIQLNIELIKKRTEKELWQLDISDIAEEIKLSYEEYVDKKMIDPHQIMQKLDELEPFPLLNWNDFKSQSFSSIDSSTEIFLDFPQFYPFLLDSKEIPFTGIILDHDGPNLRKVAESKNLQIKESERQFIRF